MAENMVRLTAMTPEMYHRYFREYENDLDLYLDKDKYTANYVTITTKSSIIG